MQLAKGADTLAKLKKQMDDKAQQALDALAEKAKKELEFRASVGLPTGKHSEKKKAPTGIATPASKNPKSSASVEVWRPNLEKDLFSSAMNGVQKLSEKKAGPASRVKPAGPSVQTDRSTAKARRASAEGDEKLTVRWVDERCEAARKGAEFALEALQRFSDAQEKLDLHGLESVEARTKVVEFVRSRRARGMRVVEVIHGVGRNSPDGYSVLRDATVTALSESPGSRDVEAFCSTERGASIVVALRASLGK